MAIRRINRDRSQKPGSSIRRHARLPWGWADSEGAGDFDAVIVDAKPGAVMEIHLSLIRESAGGLTNISDTPADPRKVGLLNLRNGQANLIGRLTLSPGRVNTLHDVVVGRPCRHGTIQVCRLRLDRRIEQLKCGATRSRTIDMVTSYRISGTAWGTPTQSDLMLPCAGYADYGLRSSR